MKHFIYVLFAIGYLCTATIFMQAQEIFVCTTSLPDNACLNDFEEIVACSIHNQEEANNLEKCYKPIEVGKYYALYSTTGRHLVAQVPIGGKPCFVLFGKKESQKRKKNG